MLLLCNLKRVFDGPMELLLQHASTRQELEVCEDMVCTQRQRQRIKTISNRPANRHIADIPDSPLLQT